MEDIERQRQRLAEIRKDFEVEYRFLSTDEGGRRTGPPYQMYRSDWMYEGDDPRVNGIYMIWPIFLEENGEIREPNTPVPIEGKAQMFIVDDEQRASIHAGRIHPGTRGYFMEGPNRVAEATVTQLLALNECNKA
jgi:hypothetical protein